jgi:DNA-binding GntR family transcriptional regulator
VATEVRSHLRQMIVEGRVVPGHALSENEVAASLGISRTPVREAFIKLEEEGLITVYPQYGSFVAPIRVADVYDSQFVRESLECAAVFKLVERFSSDDADLLAAMLDTQRRLVNSDSAAPFFEADEAFHATLMRMAGHERAWSVVEAAKSQHDRVRRLTVRDLLKRQAILEEHSDIIEYILQHDAAGAAAAMRRHLRGVFASVETAMARHPEFFASSAEIALKIPKRSKSAPRVTEQA